MTGLRSEPPRATLEATWLRITRETLPALAAARGWPVRADHCFQRILLDHAFGGCWYDHVAARPAYKCIDRADLARAIAMAEAIVAGDEDVTRLNRQSLSWRAR